jgi:S1-C subfamily serine protease
VWVLAPTFANAPGWPEAAVHGSFLVESVDRVAPKPPNVLVAIEDLFDDGDFPRVFDVDPDHPVGAPPATGLSPDVDQRVLLSTVLVSGDACARTQRGSGFVAAPDLVVTNAHVVAGETDTIVHTADGGIRNATVVAFDPVADLAVLRVDGLGLPALVGAEADDGETGAVYGHPRGGPLRVAPARVEEHIPGRSPDIYGQGETTRVVLVLAAALEHGDSGAAVVDADGAVVGIAFAIDEDQPAVAYALEYDSVRPLLDGAGTDAVSTGPCLDG